MRNAHHQILLIMPPQDKNAGQLQEILAQKGYELLIATSLVTALQKVSEYSPVLVICHNRIENYTGFRVYNALHPFLSVRDISFFLYLEEFKKDDVLIGLEVGIDNFIIFPFDTDTILKKIEKQLKKRMKGNMYESERFKSFFESTPVAKFMMDTETLISINHAFSEHTGIQKESTPLPGLHEVFDFAESELNEMNYKKCMSGILEYCRFREVPLMHDPSSLFDIHMVYNDCLGKNTLSGEIIPISKQDLTHKNKAEVSTHESGTADKPSVVLTQREMQVLELSSKGLAIKQIAHQLGVSARTVEKHRANIMEKTQTSNIIEAIYYLQD